MAHAIATLQAFAQTLDLCTPCTSRLTTGSKWEPTTGTKSAPARIDAIRSTVTGLTLDAATHGHLQIEDSEIENVSFTGCNLRGLTLCSVKLKNVAFCDVDFERVRLRGVDQEGVCWDELSFKDLMITQHMLSSPRSGCSSIILTLRQRIRTPQLSTAAAAMKAKDDGWGK